MNTQRSARHWALGLVALVCVNFSAHADEPPVLELYLARHGQTDWNLEKRLQGATDNHLNQTGRQQAQQLAEQLAGIQWTAVYSSNLSRAQETAALIAPQTKATPLPNLAERSFGIFEGISETAPSEQLQAFKTRSTNPEDNLDGGESLTSQAQRVGLALAQIRREQPQGSVLIVSHGGVTPLILASLLQLPPIEAVKLIRQSNDELYRVRLQEGQPSQIWKLIPASQLEQL